MKKVVKKLLLITVMTVLCMAVAVMAGAVTYNGECGAQGNNLTWEINTDTATLYIRGTGDMANYESRWYGTTAPWNEYYENAGFSYVVIEDGVTSIGNYAFGTESIRINIGAGVKSIGVLPFGIGVKSIGISEDNPYFKVEEDGNVYSKDGKDLVYVLEDIYDSYTVAYGVERILPYSFAYSTLGSMELIDMYIPETVTDISESAFHGVKANYPKMIVDDANPVYSSDDVGVLFDKEKKTLFRAPCVQGSLIFKDYFVPETVEVIAPYAFYGYNSMDKVFLTDNVTKIGSHAFEGFEGNGSKLYIPESVTSLASDFVTENGYIGGGMFVYYEGTEAEWNNLYKGSYADSEGEVYLTVYFEHIHVNDEITETCTGTEYRCVVCETVNVIEENGNGHNWRVSDYDNESCDEGRTVWYYCDECDEEKTVYYTEHSWYEDAECKQEPTCGNYGYYFYRCKNCYDIKTEDIPPTGNHSIIWFSNNDATCTEDGTKVAVCENCESGELEYAVDEGSALGHDYNAWIDLSDVSCTQDGISVRSCKRCALIDVEKEKAYGHDDNNGDGKCDECKVVLESSGTVTPDAPHTEHTYSKWVTEGAISYRQCTECGHIEIKFVTTDGDIEIEYPNQSEQPDCSFDVEAVEGEEFVLIEEKVSEGIGTEFEVLKAFDINLKNSDGVHVQPDGSVKVKLPLGWEKDGSYKVYRDNGDGTFTDMNAVRQGSHMVFDTDHFSVYIIVEETASSAPDDTTPEAPEENKKEDNVFSFLRDFLNNLLDFFRKLFGIA